MAKAIPFTLTHILFKILLISQLSSTDTVVQIIGLLRSGNSFPEDGPVLDVIENSEYTEDSQLYSEITGNGLRSAYILGQDLAARYSLIKDTQKLSEFSMKASKTNRSLMSAQAIMLGVFGLNNDTRTVNVAEEFQLPPFNGEKVDVSFNTPLPNGVYPVPFESYNKEFNYVLSPWDEFGCKDFNNFNTSEIDKKSTYIDKFNEIFVKISDSVSFISNHFLKNLLL
jgi:hypothetical protein